MEYESVNIKFIEGEKVYLRPLSSEDATGNYSRWLNDAQVCKYNRHHRMPKTRQDLIDYINEVNEDQSKLVLAICDTETDKHIGNISVDIDYENLNAEMAIVLGEKEYWKKGFAKESVSLMLSHMFSNFPIVKINVGANEENLSSVMLWKSMGFGEEGRKRKAIFKNGHFSNIIEMGLLREEWEYIS